MSESDTITPDGNTTDVVGDRIGAQVVDIVVMFVQVVAVTAVLVVVVRPETEGGARGLALLAMLTLPLYGGLLEGYWNGQTLGKRFFGVKVVDRRGRGPSLGQALLRNLPAVVLFGWLPTVVALAAIATDDRRQRVFDSIANTYVVTTTQYR